MITAIQQFNYYFDKNDFLTIYYLLEKYDITTLKDIKDRKTIDSIRNLAYKTAYYFYESDYWKAIQLYVIALHHVYSYDPKYFFAFQTLNSIFLKDTKLQQWEHEAEDNAPCYYIMYNIACEYSRYGNIYWAEEWYKGACQINPQLEAYAQNDPDMVNLLRKDTPLIEACKNPNSIDNIKKIINDGANVDEPGKENFTPLMTLFSNMEENFGLLNIQAVKLLIDKKPDYNKKDLKGMTSLHYAIRHYDNFKRVNNRDEYYNELFKIIQIMVKNGASPDLQDNEGKTPLMYAFESNHATQALKYILIDLSKNIDIKDDSGSTVLMYAAKISDETYINKIIKKGADIKAKNNEGKTPFIIACDYFYHDEDIKSLNILIKAGANVNDRDKTGRTPIMYILESNTESESLLREGIKILLNAGADPDIRDFRGLNTFDIAATKNRIKILEDVINEKK